MDHSQSRNEPKWRSLTRINRKTHYAVMLAAVRSIVLDRPNTLRIWKPYNCWRPHPPVTESRDNISTAPLMVSCTCAMHAWFCHGGRFTVGKTKLRRWVSWTLAHIYSMLTSRWLTSEQRPPSHEQDLSFMHSTNGYEHTNPQWCHWQVKALVKHKLPRL